MNDFQRDDNKWDGSWYPRGLLDLDDKESVNYFVENCAIANGCFDILHSGHLKVLKHLNEIAFKNQLLQVVAINSDTSVFALKDRWPVVPQDIRAELLTSLVWPFAVVIFDELTPMELMHCLKPKIVVKGGDYRPEDVVVWSSDCRVEIVPMEPDISTTKLRKGMSR